MEAQWQADRSMLGTTLRTQPAWTQWDYAAAVGRSVAWVKNWAPAAHYESTALHGGTSMSVIQFLPA